MADAGELVQPRASGRAASSPAAVARDSRSDSAPRSSSVGQRIASYAAQSAASPAAAISGVMARNGTRDRRVVVQREADRRRVRSIGRVSASHCSRVCGPKPCEIVSR